MLQISQFQLLDMFHRYVNADVKFFCSHILQKNVLINVVHMEAQ